MPTPSSLPKRKRPRPIVYFAFDFPDNMPMEKREQASAIIAAHIIHLQNLVTEEPSIRTSHTYMFTVMVLLFNIVADSDEDEPPLEEKSAKLDVGAFLENLFAYNRQIEEARSENEDQDSINVPELPDSLKDLDFGIGKMDAEVQYSDARIEILASRWAMEMLLLGKSIESELLVSYIQSSVKRLEKAFRLEDPQAKYFKGHLAPTAHVLEGVSDAIRDSMRSTINKMTHYWEAEPRDASQLAFGTTKRIMFGLGLSYPSLTTGALIDDLLTAYPALVDYPGLTSQIVDYRNERMEYEKLPDKELKWIRRAHRGRYKLLPLSPRGALVAVAVAYGQQSNPEVGAYIKLGRYSSLIAGVNRFLRSMGREAITDAGSRKAFGPPGANVYIREPGRDYTIGDMTYRRPLIPESAVRPPSYCVMTDKGPRWSGDLIDY
ncbi:hypothetical protein CP533_5686 [Ophiocordyceps camponoti-saundersi (nom. inval.)]|nr:hypothetical protein CP533_5686 [Ophiocordyceps camponoti-saundersi (nom. inval.)]